MDSRKETPPAHSPDDAGRARTVRRRALALAALLAWGVPLAELSAHEVPAEQTIEAFLQPQGDRLVVLIRLPTTVLVDASLPRLANGDLNLTALEQQLRLIAADVADNLEIRQADATLARPSATAVVSRLSDPAFATFSSALTHLRTTRLPLEHPIAEPQVFVDLELSYAIRPDEGGFSARLNAIRARGQQVRTVAHFIGPSGQQTVSVSGPPERVTFNPNWIEVVAQFGARGLRALLDPGNHLLLLGCLVVPVRRARNVATLLAAGVLGQVATGAMSAFRSPLAPESLAVVDVIAASAVVIAAMQNIAGARQRWVRPLVLGFGALQGFTFGGSIANAGPFAGPHLALAAIVFLLVVVLGQFWIAAVLWLIRTWLDQRGLPEPIATVVLSGLIAHSAVHRILEQGHSLPSGSDRLLVALTIGWACVILVVGLAEGLTSRTHSLGHAGAEGSTGPS